MELSLNSLYFFIFLVHGCRSLDFRNEEVDTWEQLTEILTDAQSTNEEDHRQSSSEADGYSVVDEIAAQVINRTLIKMAKNLTVLNMDNFTINSGEQPEFLFFIGLTNLEVHGLGGMVGETIEVHIGVGQPLEIRNLTIYVPSLLMTAKNYTLGGHITFPIGNKVLPLSGSDGVFTVGMSDFRISMYILMGKNMSGPFVDKLTMLVSASGMTFDADNLMGGGDIGWAFNTVLNDAAIVAFDFYKDALIKLYEDKFKQGIGKLICSILPNC